MSAAFDLACMGRAAVDLYGEQFGARLEDVATFARYLGGSPANTAVGAARLGLSVAMVSRVGDEQNGRFVREALAREGVDVSQVATDPARLTALVFLAVRDHDEFPHVFYRDNCADMAIEASHIDARFIAGCRALLVSGTHLSRPGTRAACEAAVAAARSAGRRVVLDIDYRPVLWGLVAHSQGAERSARSLAATQSIAALLPQCDLVVGTEEEFCIAGGSTDLASALRAVRDATPALLVVKLGARGCIAFDAQIPQRLADAPLHAGFPIEVLNVLGAGDAFMAGFLAAWLRGGSLVDCCRQANACGAIVVSRHGCSPAMATTSEVEHFLARGRDLDHVHRATTRRKLSYPLHVLAFDHRAQLEALAKMHGAAPARIAAFKALVAGAFVRASQGRSGGGVLLDERFGHALLPRLTGHGYWIARPVEVPGSVPVRFEAGTNVGLAMRAWPTEHVAKCLVLFHPADPPSLQAEQLAMLAALQEACAATGRELLLEVIATPREGDDASVTARAMEAIYAAGVRPDWWKLPPSTEAPAWRAIDRAIERHDALCRGILVLGMEADPSELGESFAVAARSPWVRGFAVGRSIFAPAAAEWFAGKWNDARVVEDVIARYTGVIGLWEKATGQQQKETA
ncbi:MAG TPA: 5-dehydro-2-deoxygluconokinase [Usitatibacter sp.]|nr:5-dehydro-2-deoxygluconokinase [Usitatibacter sp.]